MREDDNARGQECERTRMRGQECENSTRENENATPLAIGIRL